MKIAIFVDKHTTAIDRLAQMVKANNPHLAIIVQAVHPKRNSAEDLESARKLMEWADVLDIHYWKSGEVLKENYGALFASKPKILFHFNPYDLDKQPWSDTYDMVVVGNGTLATELPSAYHVPYGVDLGFFSFAEQYVEKNNAVVNMVVGRIEGKKGVLEVAQACRALGYTLRLAGRISNMDYMQQVMATGAVEFLENCTDEQLRDVYYTSAVHVCNSVDGFESGTLPILEAMACGLPVLTRAVGHVPDINNGANMVVRKGAQDDIQDLQTELQELMKNYDLRLNLRERAFNTVRTYDSRKMALRIAKLYYKIWQPDKELVSIILPTKDNPEAVAESLVAAVQQDYPKLELVVVDSGDLSIEPLVDALRAKTTIPIKYIHFPHKGSYTLAEARNRGIVEASGSLLIFCDDRIAMKPNAVTQFAGGSQSKTWLWGVKDGTLKGFVENFSAVRRDDVIAGGMFCERMQHYGGMSQEIRTRFENKLGFLFLPVPEAQAVGVKKSGNKHRRKQEIIEAKHLLYKLYGD